MATAVRIAPSRGAGLVMVAVGGALFGLNQPLSRVLMDGPLPPPQMVGTRLISLAVAFGGWALLVHRDALPRGRDLAVLCLFGVLGIAVLQWTATEAISRMDAAVFLTFVYAASFPTAVFCRLAWKERQPPAVWLAMVVALGGLVLALGVGGDAFAQIPTAGIVFAGATCLLFAYYSIHGTRLVGRHPAPVVLGVGATAAALVWTTTAAPLWEYPTAVLTEDVSLGGRLDDLIVPGLAALGVSIVFGTVVPYALYLVGMGRVGPTLGVITGTIEPIVAVVVSWIWLDQRLEPLQLVGCAIVIGAVVIVQATRAQQPATGGVT